MTSIEIEQAAACLIEARTSSRLLDELPASCRPETLDDAHAIQETISSILECRIVVLARLECALSTERLRPLSRGPMRGCRLRSGCRLGAEVCDLFDQSRAIV